MRHIAYPRRRRRHIHPAPTVIALLALICLTVSATAATTAHAGLPDPGSVTGWHTVTGPAGDNDLYHDVAVGGPDQLIPYAAGCMDLDYGSGTGYLLMSRYFADGSTPAWTRSWQPLGYAMAGATAVAADAAGNVVAAGYCRKGDQTDIAVIKRDMSGNIVWWDVRDGAAHGYDSATDVVTDGAGNVYVCATQDDSARAVVLKYAADPDPDGFMTARLLWEKATRPTVTPGSAQPWGLAYADGALYLTGERTTRNGRDCFLRKLGRDGTTKWLRGWDGVDHRFDYGQAVAVYQTSGPDAVYVAGGSKTRPHGWDLVLLKYSIAGKRLWARTYDGAAHERDEAYDLAVDSRGRARVVGSTFGAGGSTARALLVGWNADGNGRWARTYRAASGDEAVFSSVVTRGTAIWTAGFTRTASLAVWVAARYAGNGTRAWLTRWSGPSADPRGGSANACVPCGSTALFVAGDADTAVSHGDAAVVWFRR